MSNSLEQQYTPSHPGSAGRQRGFTLMEVLIAILILSIGMLGMAGLQTRSLQMNQSAHLSSQASYLAYEIVDRMRANRTAALNGSYNRNALAGAAPGTGSIADRDVTEWLRTMRGEGDQRGVLPQRGNDTGGTIAVDNQGNAVVTIVWFDARWEEDEGDQVRTLTIRAEI